MVLRWMFVAMATLFAGCNGQSSSSLFEEEESGIILSTISYADDTQLRFIRSLPDKNETWDDVDVTNATILSEDTELVSVVTDRAKKEVYFYDYFTRSIIVGYNYGLNPDQMELKSFHLGINRGTIQMAVDYVTGLLYWVDSVFAWIVCAPVQKEKIEKGIFMPIITTNLARPNGIAIDAVERLLIWIDNYDFPKIERSKPDGEERRTLEPLGFSHPRSLVLDVNRKTVYVADAVTERIIHMNYDGGEQGELKYIPASNMYSIDIYKNMLIVSDPSAPSVFFIHKDTGEELATPYQVDYEYSYGVAVYDDYNQPPSEDSTICEALKCDHICINSRKGPRCECGDGYVMNITTNICDAKHGVLRAAVLVNATHICLADIRSFALNTQADTKGYPIKCIFTVINKRQPVPTFPPRRKRQANESTATSPTSVAAEKTTTTTTKPLTTSPSTKPPTTTPTTTTTTTPAPTAAPGDIIRFIEVDSHRRVVFLSTADNSIYTIPIDKENAPMEELTAATGTVSSLAYDWINEYNLYHSDSESGNVYVTNIIDKATTKVNTQNTLNGTRDVVILPHERALAWIADTENGPIIQTMFMDGTALRNLTASTGHELSELTVDQHKQTLFYLNASSFFSDPVYELAYNSTAVGGAVPIRRYYADLGSVGLIRYRNYVIWVYSGHSFTAFDHNYRRVTGGGDFAGMGDILDMKVLDSLHQQTEPNACAYENGGCEQICIAKHEGNSHEFKQECKCTLGYILGKNKKSCESTLVSDNVAFLTDWTFDQMYQLNLDDDTIAGVDTGTHATFMGTLFDGKTLIWSELYETGIYASELQNMSRQLIGNAGTNYPNRFTKDHSTGNLYFTTYLWSTVVVMTPKGDVNELLDFFLDDVNGIAVHPQKGKNICSSGLWNKVLAGHCPIMNSNNVQKCGFPNIASERTQSGIFLLFCLADSFGYSYVGKAALDGTNLTRLIEGDHVLSPDGIDIDYKNGYFYWSDSLTDTIQKCDFDAKHCTDFTQDEGAMIKDIALDDEFLYYVSWTNLHVTRVNLTSGEKTILGKSAQLGRLDTISLYRSGHMIEQPVTEVCRANGGRGNCSTICYPVSDSEHICGCETGEQLMEDKRTCSNAFQCPVAISQWADENEMDKISIPVPDSCLRYVDTQCQYTCPDKYEPVDKQNTKLQCTGVGWDREMESLCKAIRCPETIANGAFNESCIPTAGNSCDFTCGTSYDKVVESITCLNQGSWNVNPSSVCKVKQCTNVIPNGEFDTECSLKANTNCEFKCKRGYLTDHIDKNATCTPDGVWKENINDICQEIECPMDIGNGRLGDQCSKKVGTSCNYTCNTGFKKPVKVVQIHCLEGGTWFANKQAACSEKCSVNQFTCPDSGRCIPEEKQCDKVQDCDNNSDENHDACRTCPDVFDNGKLIDGCTKTQGSVCEPVCDYGYHNTSHSIICANNNKWQPAHPGVVCKETMCSMDFENGTISRDCSRKVNSSCSYSCHTKFARNKDVGSVKCLESGIWDGQKDMCISSVTGVTGKNTSDDDTSVKQFNVLLVVVIALGILLLGFIVLAAYLFTRGKRGGGGGGKPPYAAGSFNDGSYNRKRNTANIESSGNRQVAEMAFRNDNTDFSNTNPNQMQPARNLYTPTGSLTWRDRPSSTKANESSTERNDRNVNPAHTQSANRQGGNVNPTYTQSANRQGGNVNPAYTQPTKPNGDKEPMRHVTQIDVTKNNVALTQDSNPAYENTLF